MHVVITGCGIAGLALALTLRQQGIRYTVLERSAELAFVGAGIQLSPNATRVLRYLGVFQHLEPHLVFPQQHRFLSWDSAEVLLTTPLGGAVDQAFASPYAHVHRADLLDALMTELGDDPNVRMNADVEKTGTSQDSAFALLTDGTRIEADVLIAADGVRSAIRQAHFRPEAPKHSGCMAWRGLTPKDAVQGLEFERNSYIWMGPERSVVIYYVAGGELLNWIAMGPSDGQTRESWTIRGTVEAALAEFEGWHPRVRSLIERSAPPFKWALFDREPLQSWIHGRIALIGDAAHAMLPYHAQGGAQSLEDAWVLGRSLAIKDNIDDALRHYQSLRLPRTSQVQGASRRAERMFHLSDSEAVRRRNERFARTQTQIGDGFPPGQEWLFAYDSESAVLGLDKDWQKLAWG